jgi:hypothetical protein
LSFIFKQNLPDEKFENDEKSKLLLSANAITIK